MVTQTKQSSVKDLINFYESLTVKSIREMEDMTGMKSLPEKKYKKEENITVKKNTETVMDKPAAPLVYPSYSSKYEKEEADSNEEEYFRKSLQIIMSFKDNKKYIQAVKYNLGRRVTFHLPLSGEGVFYERQELRDRGYRIKNLYK